MNENLNLVEILKDCPKDTKLYSIMHNEVKFSEIREDSIICKAKILEKTLMPLWLNCEFRKDGTIKGYPGTECVLFPSKDQRDWSKFKAEQIEPELIDGEIYYAKFYSIEWIYIYKRNNTFKTNYYAALMNGHLIEYDKIFTTHNEDIKVLRKATEEEKRLFFETIKKNGRKWDADKKELVRIEPKFDISTLQPFDKVLGREDDNSLWNIDFYECYNDELKCFGCAVMPYDQCIPYNDETKHLLRTTEMPPEKYITWEE